MITGEMLIGSQAVRGQQGLQGVAVFVAVAEAGSFSEAARRLAPSLRSGGSSTGGNDKASPK